MTDKPASACFIFNPAANRSGSRKQLKIIKSFVQEHWEESEVRVTEKKEDISRFARESAGMYELIVACGGDGTVNGVVNGIAGSGRTLGVIPLGSGNDFATSINLPDKTEDCLRILKQGNRKRIDLILCEGDADHWCANTLGIGLDGLANYLAGSIKRFKGRTVYILGILRAILKFRGTDIRLEVDGETLDNRLMMITACNGPEEGGGFIIAPDADNADGWIDLLVIDKISIPRLMWYVPKFLINPGENLKGINRYKCRNVLVKSEAPLAVHCDGEHLGHLNDIKLSIRSEFLEIMVP